MSSERTFAAKLSKTRYFVDQNMQFMIDNSLCCQSVSDKRAKETA